jgi:hypothetical protein
MIAGYISPNAAQAAAAPANEDRLTIPSSDSGG